MMHLNSHFEPRRSPEGDRATSAGPFVQPDPFRKVGLPAAPTESHSISHSFIDCDKGQLELISVKPLDKKTDIVVILGHGNWSSAETMFPLMEALAAQGIESHAFSHLGHGNSTHKGRKNKYSHSDYMASLDTVVKEFVGRGVSRIHLVGHSLGGYQQMDYLLRHKSEAVCSSSVLNSDDKTFLLANLKFTFTNGLRTFWSAIKAYSKMDASVAVEDPKVASKVLYNGRMPEGIKLDSASLKATLAACLPLRNLYNIGKPTQIIAAREDKLFSLKSSTRLAESLGSKLEEVDGHHMGLMVKEHVAVYAGKIAQYVLRMGQKGVH